ncbi:MAG: four helix bundle protein [Bacteroidota bacterium]|nr:four helix bundle protein [Bacteroidota bacterium]
MKSFNDLEIYQMAYAMAIKVHEMTMTLPKYELYEQGSQLKMINDIHFKNNPIIDLVEEYEVLGRKIFRFIKYVEENWKSPK